MAYVQASPLLYATWVFSNWGVGQRQGRCQAASAPNSQAHRDKPGGPEEYRDRHRLPQKILKHNPLLWVRTRWSA